MTEVHAPRPLTMDEVYRWMVSNPLTAKDMLADIVASKELGLKPDADEFCNAKPIKSKHE